jgi:elongation factor 1-beta
MGTVAVSYRIMPVGVDVDLDDLKERVGETLGESLKGLQVKPIAFGLSAIQATVLVPDGTDEAQRLEGRLRDLADVESVEIVDVTLI